MRDCHQISFALPLPGKGKNGAKKRERKSGKRRLQTERMSRFEAKRHALGGLPARRPTAGGIVQRSSIQAKAGNHGESVTVSSIYRDPFPPSAISVGAQLSRTQRGANKAGTRQSVGNSARAVIAAVIEGAMAPAVSIRFRAQLICRPDGALHGEWGVCWRQGQSATEPRLVSRGGWSGRRKRTGKAGLRREDKNRGAKNRPSNRNFHEVSISVCYATGCSRSRQEVQHKFVAMHWSPSV
jgi:hypothetical protein